LSAWSAVSTLDRMASPFGTGTNNLAFNHAIDVRASDTEVNARARTCRMPATRKKI
jgi:hypothetical protein